jgi:hypothetical protein
MIRKFVLASALAATAALAVSSPAAADGWRHGYGGGYRGGWGHGGWGHGGWGPGGVAAGLIAGVAAGALVGSAARVLWAARLRAASGLLIPTCRRRLL